MKNQQLETFKKLADKKTADLFLDDLKEQTEAGLDESFSSVRLQGAIQYLQFEKKYGRKRKKAKE